jgi:hypothetical protein
VRDSRCSKSAAFADSPKHRPPYDFSYRIAKYSVPYGLADAAAVSLTRTPADMSILFICTTVFSERNRC